jgi:hypothetical protein
MVLWHWRRNNRRWGSWGPLTPAAAAREAGARRVIAQSIAWVYAPGPEPHTEEDPLDLGAAGMAAIQGQA